MKAPDQEFVERIAAAMDLADIAAACADAAGIGLRSRSADATGRFSRNVATALHAHLGRRWRHSRYRLWLDGYFGRVPVRFRSPLQQPNFLYYPALEPKPWFDAGEVPELARLAGMLPGVSEELREHLGLQQSGFSPYVPEEAASSGTWSPLAGKTAWSALHLVRRGEGAEEHLSSLPRTAAFLEAAPLAMCPPHAPECFISRLQPGTVLPPHFGLSNIKLTAHLPVQLPPSGCTITVAHVCRTWREGDFLIFDDSFLHTASNLSDTARTVMIFDVWHPGLEQLEREALAYSIRALDEVRKITG